MPDTQNPQSLPAFELPMTRRRATFFAYAGFSLICLSVVASILTTAGFMSTLGAQICGAIGAATSSLGYLFVRQAPSSALSGRSRNEADR